MRRTATHRVGALGLSLLLQLFVLSGLVHPCCLGLAEALGIEVVAAEMEHHSSHGESHAPAADGMHAAASGATVAHGELAHQAGVAHGELAHQAGAAHSEVAHADAGANHAHHDGGSSDDDCNGNCGLCCSTASSLAPPAVGATVASAANPPSVEVASPGQALPGTTPRSLLPFANAPPAAPTTSV